MQLIGRDATDHDRASVDAGRPLASRESPLWLDDVDAAAARVRCLECFNCGEGSRNPQRDRGEVGADRCRPWRARGSASPLQTRRGRFPPGCGDLRIPDGPRAESLGRP
jgi:hypothetical protein